MTKLFASDFDGTLCLHGENGEDEGVLASDLEAIRAFQAEGGLFGACTGRPVRALTVQTEGLVPFDFYIALTGATLHDRNVWPILEAELPRELVRTLYERCRPFARDGLVMVCAADNYHAVGTPVEGWPILFSPTFDDVPAPTQGIGMEVDTILTARRLADEINAELGDVVACFVNLASIDVLPAGHSKGTGLVRAAAHFGASLTAGIGDSLNDLPLLEAADVAYTFRRASDEMRAAADVLVDSVAEALADFARR